MAWFGSLDLAYKYAIVFGAALLITLVAGFTKVLLDRRKMTKLMKLADHEKQSGVSSADDAILNMREKDEGDLFGIRAIEAGYYGGVAQSAPNSPAVSRRGSRNNSPAPSLRIPYGSYNPSGSTPQILVNQHYSNHAGNTTSTSSSILDLAGYRDSIGQSSVASRPSLRHSKSTPSIIDQQQQPVDSVFSVLAPTAYTPSSLSPLRQPQSAKLRPSQAELSGRNNHTSTYSSNGPPSPTSGQDCPLHGSPQQPVQGRSSLGPALPLQTPNRTSTMSLQSSVFPFPEEWEESMYGEPARLVDGPEKKGKKTIEVGSLDNPSIDETSQRGSVISRVTSTSSVGQERQPKKQSPPPVPAMPMRLPLFQKNAIIGTSNPEFDKFRKQRMHLEPREDDKMFEEDEEPTPTTTTYTEPTTPTTPTRKQRNHLSVVSPRTSFSFEYANSESTHPEQRAFTAEPAPRILTRQPYSKGAYNPAGR